MLRKVARTLLNPKEAAFGLWKTSGLGSLKTRLKYDLCNRPHYLFCVYHAARSAAKLGLPEISVLEFGVAGGNGLLELERVANEVEKEFPVKVSLYGFDSGEGLPAPQGYRDLPYIWKESFFKMDVPALKAKLSRSNLVLGNVTETVPKFVADNSHAPIGAVMCDLDYYSSTIDSFKLFNSDSSTRLPRVYLYFDDIISNEFGGIMCDSVGQLCAIKEFNGQSERLTMQPIAGLKEVRQRPARWNDQIYVLHDFDHPEYCTYVHDSMSRQLPLGKPMT